MVLFCTRTAITVDMIMIMRMIAIRIPMETPNMRPLIVLNELVNESPVTALLVRCMPRQLYTYM